MNETASPALGGGTVSAIRSLLQPEQIPKDHSLHGLLQQANSGVLQRSLEYSGMTADESVLKAKMFASAAELLLQSGSSLDASAAAFWVPGRIEVAGKHTDYAGGRSLLCAATRGFAAVSAVRADAACSISASFASTGLRASAQLPLSSSAESPADAPWALHPAAAIRRLASNFSIERGVDIAFECDLPEASGMSSSSAVICLCFLSLAHANDLHAHPILRRRLSTEEDLCHYLGCIENGQDFGEGLPGHKGVGTFGGSEDHTAIMCCEANRLRTYSFCPTRLLDSFELPSSLRFVIGVSGALAQKSADKMEDYNNAAILAQHAAVTLAAQADAGTRDSAPPTLAAAVRDIAKELGLETSHERVRATAMKRLATTKQDGHGAAALQARAWQFMEESEVIVPRLSEALRDGRLDEVSALVDRSQQLTESHLQNTVAETEWLPAEARRVGAIAASAFGAGFGGSCWALVHAADAEMIKERWEAAYRAEFPLRTNAVFFCLNPGPGALRLCGDEASQACRS